MAQRHLLLASAALIPTIAVSSQAAAQATLDPPQLRQSIDEQGVDLATGELVLPSSRVSIGGERGLSHQRYRVPNGWRHNFILSIASGTNDLGPTLRVQIGGSLREYLIDNGSYVALHGDNGTLTESGGIYTYTDAAGTEYTFDANIVNQASYYEVVVAVGTKIERPDGFEIDLTYRNDSFLDGDGDPLNVMRLQSVNSSTGYQLKYSYEADTPSVSTLDDWYELSRVTAINNAEEYCDPTADSCSLTGAWPYLNYSKAAIANNETMEYVTDQANRTIQFRIDPNDRLLGVRRAGYAEHATVSYDANDRVYVHVDFRTGYRRDYAWSNDPQGNLVVTARDNADTDRARTVVTNPDTLQVVTDTDAYGRTTGYTYDTDGRLMTVSTPGDTRVEYEYDTLGRVTKVTRLGKQLHPATPRDEIEVSTLTYPTNCANPITCYQPLSSEDALGNVTNYTWDQTHGGLLSVMAPAPAPGQDRPTTVINYAAHRARFKDSTGALIDGEPLTLVTTTYQCKVAATCFGTADELRTTYTYGQTSGAHNLQVSQVNRYSIAGGVGQAITFTYDGVGNVLAVDGPLAGTDDTVTYVYDNAYQVVGTISPDPDGTGSQPHLAERTTYDNRGIVTKVESGTVTGTDSAAWAAFSPYQEYNTTIDAAGRPTSVTHKVPGGAEISRTDYGYDYAGRLECTAVRMDPATWASASDACVQSSAANTDRISRSYYDLSDRVFEGWSGVGTPLAQATVKVQHNATDGTIDWVEDAKGNRTGYTYDDHFRTTAITYPDKTAPNTISTSDSESITYDDGDRITSYTNRAGETFNFTYDNLNRLTVKDVPYDAARADHTRDVHYIYDLFGNLTQARFDSTAGEGVIFHYNALSQNYYQYTFMGSEPRGVSRFFDKAGRTTMLVHPDGEQFRYSYDTLGRLDKVFQGPPVGTVVLADATYSDVGNMTRMDRSGTTAMRTDYAYDAAGRVTSRDMNVNTGGTYRNVMTQSYNAANQATVETSSNAAYAAGGVGATQIDYTANGLNQYDTVDASNFGYDANGNLTSDGTTTYTYDTENRLITVSGPSNNATLTYDPLGRLWQVEDGVGNKRRMLYDGDALIAESGPGATYAPTKRYVHGTSAGDDPLVMYDGSTVALSNARFLYTDSRGSVIAEMLSNGQPDRLPLYDEFGVHMVPNSVFSSTPSRFGYTGQVWVPEAGLYYYKARMYSPTLGRFMQTDPIGYADGLNNLAYVGNDPVNWIDPLGLNGRKPDEDGKCGPGEYKDSEDGLCYKIETTIDVFGQGGQPIVGGSGASLGGLENGGNCGGPCNAQASTDGKDILITAKRLPKGGVSAGDIGSRLLSCGAQQLGISNLIEADLVRRGLPEPGSKRFVTEGSSPGTSRMSRFLSSKFPQQIPGGRIWTPDPSFLYTFKPEDIRRLGRRSVTVGRALGRLIPVVSAGLLIYDIASVGICAYNGQSDG